MFFEQFRPEPSSRLHHATIFVLGGRAGCSVAMAEKRPDNSIMAASMLLARLMYRWDTSKQRAFRVPCEKPKSELNFNLTSHTKSCSGPRLLLSSGVMIHPGFQIRAMIAFAAAQNAQAQSLHSNAECRLPSTTKRDMQPGDVTQPASPCILA